MAKNIPSHELYSTRRIEALSDGVFAIAMTLLVLNLNVPSIAGQATETKLWQALSSMSTNLADFVVSFLLLGSAWAVHMRQFEFIRYGDRHLTMINTLRLLVVVFIPFTTSLAGDYTGLLLAKILLPINFFLLGVVSAWQWGYACKHQKSFAPDLTAEEMRHGKLRNTIFLFVSAVVVLLSFFIGTWAFLLFFALPVLVRTFAGRKPTITE